MAMAGEPDNVVLVYRGGASTNLIVEYLRHLDANLMRDLKDIGDLKSGYARRRLARTDVAIANLELSIAGVNRRFDRVEARLDRIERRLDLVEPPH